MWKLAIDLGSSVTKIYRADTNNGIVLVEPSCVAVSGAEESVRAWGREAKNLIGKTADCTSVVYPVFEGEIVRPRLAAEMLTEFLQRVGVKKSAFRRAQILMGIPCGASQATVNAYVNLAEECGLKNVFFVEQPYLVATSVGATVGSFEPVFCLDIGGGTTNVAVVSVDGIISGLSMNIGGNNMDLSIRMDIQEHNRLQIGALTAERLKNELVNLSPTAMGAMVAEGCSVDSYRPASSSIRAQEIRSCVTRYLDKVVEYATMVIRNLPAEVAAIVNRNGVYLSGGVMKIPGVASYIGERLEMRYFVSEEPQFSTAQGAGALLRDKDLLRSFAKEID
ncbi:MAG: rod shape-determining protein [Clostridia bacterium]|nr:rod shape-determining protein [Clostridia bacterium]